MNPDDDRLIKRAIQLVRQHDTVSVAFLQRMLIIGYPRAVRLMAQLEERGIVGPDQGPQKPRAVVPEVADVRCAQCGAKNRVDDKFCEKCGTPLSRRASPLTSIMEFMDIKQRWIQEMDTWSEGQFQQIILDSQSARTIQDAQLVGKDILEFIRELIAKKREFNQILLEQQRLCEKLDLQIQQSLRGVLEEIGQDDSRVHARLDDMIAQMRSHLDKVDGFIKIQAEESRVVGRTEVRPATDTTDQLASESQRALEQNQSRSLDELLDELNSLTGLGAVKKDVAGLINFLKVQQLRKSSGLPSPPVSLHHVFYGNPGTGKTTVARLLAQIFQSLGLLTEGHLAETDRSGLVAGYVGQTALKVDALTKKALGGILFIDEAYALAGEGQDYGQEAIETLLKQMEDHRDNLVVVVAGYPDRMNAFLASNPGLRSRFNRFLHFDDYTPSELVSIFESFCHKGGYSMSVPAKEKLESIFLRTYEGRDKAFGNARFARNLFERAITNQASRIVGTASTDPQSLSALDEVDIQEEMMTDELP